MTIETNANNRKVLAQAISEEIGKPVHYLGVPSCAYQVGPYTINRDGSVSGDDFEAIHSFLVENDYIHETVGVTPEAERETEQEAEAPCSAADSGTDAVKVIAEALENVPSIDSVTETTGISQTYVSIPIQEFTPLALTCLLKTLYARQKLISAMTKSDLIRIDEELITRLQDEKPETAEQIQKILENEIAVDMVSGVRIEEGKLELTFPFDESKLADWQAYANILLAVARRAKTAHHVSAAILDPKADEMKYFCRNWLLQLGLGGPEHKETRRVLIGHLTGFAAFRTADKMQEHRERYAAQREKKREASQIQEQGVTQVE